MKHLTALLIGFVLLFPSLLKAGDQVALVESNDNCVTQSIENTSLLDAYQEARIKGDYNIVIQVVGKVSPEVLEGCLTVTKERAKLARALGMTEEALSAFFKTLGRDKPSREDWPQALADIATAYHDLQQRLSRLEGEDPELKGLLEEVRTAIEQGRLDVARRLLDRAGLRANEVIDDSEALFLARLLDRVAIDEIYGDVEVLALKYEQAGRRYLKAFRHLDGKTGEAMRSEEIRERLINDGLKAGRYLHEAGLYSEALPIKEQTLALAERYLPPTHPTLAISLNNLASLYSDKGDYDKALPLFQRDIKIKEKALGADHPNLATSLNNLANLYSDKGDYDKALPLFQRAIKIKEKALGADHPDLAKSLNNLASLYSDKGDYDKALPLFQRAIKIKEKALGADHPDLAKSLNNLAELYRTKGDYDKAEHLFERAIAIYEKALGADHPNLAIMRENLETLRQKMKEPSPQAD